MNKEKKQKVKLFNEHLDTRYGKPGTRSRNHFDKEFEAFNLGTIIKEARVFRKLTQEILAGKAGTTKYYISRVENNASDIRLSTLRRIVYEGLEGKLKFELDFKN